MNAREQLRLAEARYAQGLGSVIELGDAQVARHTPRQRRTFRRGSICRRRGRSSWPPWGSDEHEEPADRRIDHVPTVPRRTAARPRTRPGRSRRRRATTGARHRVAWRRDRHPARGGRAYSCTSGRNEAAGATAAGADGERGRRAAARRGRRADRVVPVLVRRSRGATCRSPSRGSAACVAYKTVNVRTQVDGRLDRVALHARGRRSSAAICWRRSIRRPFTIQLHQAEAALARDRRSCRAPS